MGISLEISPPTARLVLGCGGRIRPCGNPGDSGRAENALNWALAWRLLAPLTGLEPVHTAPVRRPSRSGHRRCGDWAYPDYEAVVSPQGVGERRCRGADSNYWLEEVTHPADVVLVLEVHGPASTFDDRGRCALYRDRELLRDCGRASRCLRNSALSGLDR